MELSVRSPFQGRRGGTAAGTWQDAGESSLLEPQLSRLYEAVIATFAPFWNYWTEMMFKKRFTNEGFLRLWEWLNYTADYGLEALMYQVSYSGLDLRSELWSDNEDHTRAITFSCTCHDIS